MSQFPPPSPETILALKAKYSQYSNIFANKPINDTSNFDGYDVASIRTAYKYNGIQKQNFKIKPLIAIVIPYAYSRLQENFDLFCTFNNLPSYILNLININAVENSSWSTEECVDTQWSYAICPEANILVVEAESSSVQNLAVAIDVARSYGPAVINMSWGFNEFNGQQDEPLASLFAYRGNYINHVFVASSGDDGTVQWPSTSTNVISVGGTTLLLKPDGSIDQTTWDGTGCGPSKFFKIPGYQKLYTDLTSKYRNTVDLSSVGNVVTGVQIFYESTIQVCGGTSIAAPQISGMMAIANGIRLNNDLELLTSDYHSLTLGVQNILYSNYSSNGKELFYDVTKGTAGSNDYPATKDWDIPTGLGTPYGEAVVTFLSNQPNQPNNFSRKTVATFRLSSGETGSASYTIHASGSNEKASDRINLRYQADMVSRTMLQSYIYSTFGQVSNIIYTATPDACCPDLPWQGGGACPNDC
jgi:subtilase family serine protease